MDDEVGRVISHDLRGPVRRLTALIQLAQEKAGPLPEPATEFMDMALAEAQTLQSHLEALQEYVRVERAKLQESEVDLGAILAATSQHVKQRLDVEPLPIIRFDARHAHRVTEILVDNAATYGDGRIRVLAEDAGDAIHIHVHDDGEGVSPRLAQNVFRLFQPVRDQDGGTRLTSSLAIARRMAQHAGGDIHLGPSQGGHFIWRIPKERAT